MSNLSLSGSGETLYGYGFTTNHNIDGSGGLDSLTGENNWLLIANSSGVIGCSKEALTGSNSPETCQKLSEGHQICNITDSDLATTAIEVSSVLYCSLIDVLCQQVGLCEQRVCPNSEACQIPAENSYICDKPTEQDYKCEALGEGKQLCDAESQTCISLREDKYLCTETATIRKNKLKRYQKKIKEKKKIAKKNKYHLKKKDEKKKKKYQKKKNRRKNKKRNFRKNPRYRYYLLMDLV